MPDASKLCGNCAYWKSVKEADLYAVHEPFMEGLDKYQICALAAFFGDGETEIVSLATARDASGYQACLFTRAQFGCVQFAPAAPVPAES